MFWLIVAILAVAIGGLGIARLEGHRPLGASILAGAVVLALFTELLIRIGTITVGQGTDLMSVATLILIGLIVTFVVRSERA